MTIIYEDEKHSVGKAFLLCSGLVLGITGIVQSIKGIKNQDAEIKTKGAKNLTAANLILGIGALLSASTESERNNK